MPAEMPKWFTLWLVRGVLFILGLGTPLYFTAQFHIQQEQLAEQKELRIEVTKHGEQMLRLQGQLTDLAMSVQHNSAATRKLIEEDVSEIKVQLARGILPGAENQIAEMKLLLTRVQDKLTVAPADVKAELKQLEDRINKRLDRLEGR